MTALVAAVVAMLASCSEFASTPRIEAERPPIQVALVGPFTGPGASAGRQLRQGVELYLSDINAAGGVSGRSVAVRIYDDQNDPTLARARARDVVSEGRAAAVIGHWYSECSVAAASTYAEARLPALTPGSTSVRVTKDKPWYFSTIYSTRLPGQLMAHYLERVLRVDRVVLLYEPAAYGRELATVFEAAASSVGLDIALRVRYADGPTRAAAAVARLLQDPNGGDDATTAIVIATKAEAGARLVRALRDAGIGQLIFGPSSFSERAFIQALNESPTERGNAGYYSNGVYALSPLMFASANAQAQRFRRRYRERYGEEPGWTAAFAYDSVAIIAHALDTGRPIDETLAPQRARLRDRLASFNTPGRGVEGITGLTFFGPEGSAEKPPAVGVYRGRELVPATTQLKTIRRPYATLDQSTDVDRDRVIALGDVYLYKTDIVYTGFDLKEISRIRPGDLAFDADFFLWFRHRSRVSPDDIEFINGVGDVTLGSPLSHSITGGMHYSLYRVRGTFRAESLAHRYVLGNAELPIRLRHRSVGPNDLIYVGDSIGMEKGGAHTGPTTATSLAGVVSPSTGWIGTDFSCHRDVSHDSSLGAPSQIALGPESKGYSVFNCTVNVRTSDLSLGRLLSHSAAVLLLPAALLVGFLTVVWRRRRGARKGAGSVGLLIVAGLMTLVSVEVVAFHGLANLTHGAALVPYAAQVFEALWWLVPAVLLNTAITCLFWDPIERRSGYPVPTTVRRGTLLLLLLFAVFGIVAFVFDQKITSLLATSGVVAMIVGLAIQINISNIVSGLILNMEKPFKIGDWIQVGEEIGRVVDINWRATRLHTLYDNIIAIPNSKVAETTVINYHYPTSAGWFGFSVHVQHEHDPSHVKAVLEQAVAAIPEVLEPWVAFSGLTDWSAEYGVYYKTHGFSRRYQFRDQVWHRIWADLKRHGITPAVRRQQIQILDERPDETALGGLSHPSHGAPRHMPPMTASLSGTDARAE